MIAVPAQYDHRAVPVEGDAIGVVHVCLPHSAPASEPVRVEAGMMGIVAEQLHTPGDREPQLRIFLSSSATKRWWDVELGRP